MGIPITVYVPESTSEIVREKLKEHGAKVEVYGKVRKCVYQEKPVKKRDRNLIGYLSNTQTYHVTMLGTVFQSRFLIHIMKPLFYVATL